MIGLRPNIPSYIDKTVNAGEWPDLRLDSTSNMKVFRGFHHPDRAPACALTIGNFDGVHRGHKAVISRAKVLAEKRRAPLAVLTFEPHPADYFAGKSVVFRMTPEAARAKAL